MFILNMGVASDRVNNVRASNVNNLRTLIGENPKLIEFFMLISSLLPLSAGLAQSINVSA